MNYKVNYQVENKICPPHLGDIAMDGEIGTRFDRFIYERVSGQFAIDYILREAEECIRDKYDDEYCHGVWRSEFWGKLMLSAVRVCHYKKDNVLKENIRKSVYRILQYQDETGYVGTYYDRENIFRADTERSLREIGEASYHNWNVWGQKYTLWALLESAMLLEDEHVLVCCRRLVDQLMELLERKGVRLKDTGVMEGMAAGSILKPMLMLYRLTGDEKYYDFCLEAVKEWEREDGECPNLITNALSGISPADWYQEDGEGWYAKAYEMMSCFDGLIELYRISGNEKYIDAVKAFWTSVRRDEENVLGSVGYCEAFSHAADYPDAATEVCDVIHWMRLSYELFCLTGEAKYMDAFEKAYLNAFLAGVYEDGKSGAFFIRSAGRHWAANWHCQTKYQHCCVNNVARGFVNAAQSMIMQDEQGYYVNMYTQARVRFGETTFRISSGYADHGQVAITIRGTEAGKKLYLRIPQWSRKTIITVIGGESQEITAPGSYHMLSLTGGEQVIRLFFDMTPKVLDFGGEFRELPDSDYHRKRWVDENNGACDVSLMTHRPMSTVCRGPVLLARSKRIGCDEADMFNHRTVWGRQRTVTASVVRHDRMLCACRVDIQMGEESYTYLMCDYASAANRDLEDARYFTIFV